MPSSTTDDLLACPATITSPPIRLAKALRERVGAMHAFSNYVEWLAIAYRRSRSRRAPALSLPCRLHCRQDARSAPQIVARAALRDAFVLAGARALEVVLNLRPATPIDHARAVECAGRVTSRPAAHRLFTSVQMRALELADLRAGRRVKLAGLLRTAPGRRVQASFMFSGSRFLQIMMRGMVANAGNQRHVLGSRLKFMNSFAFSTFLILKMATSARERHSFG